MAGSGKYQTYILLLHAAVGGLVILAATVLAALHDLDPQAAVAIFGAAIGLAGGSAGSIAMLGTAVNGKNVVTQNTLNNLSENLARTVAYLADARKQIDGSTLAGGRRATDPAQPQPPPAPPE